MRTILYLILCSALLSQAIFARVLCPPCYSTTPPMSGHGTAPDGTGRRKLIVYIDSSWDVSPGNTDVAIWEAVNDAIRMWNAARDQYTNWTCYYFEIEQRFGRNDKDIVIEKASSSVVTGGCADITLSGTPRILRLSERIPPLADVPRAAVVAHEFGHPVGLQNESSCVSIMRGQNNCVPVVYVHDKS